MAFETPNFTNILLQGYDQARGVKRQEGLDNALATYAQAPDDPASVAAIARYDPRTAIQIGQMQQKRQSDMQKVQQEKLAEGQKAVGQAALLISQLPAEQQPQAWDQQIDQLVSMGWDGLAQYKGKYSPQALQAVVAQSGLAGEYMAAQRPRITSVEPGGYVMATDQSGGNARYIVAPGGVAPSTTPAAAPELPAGFVIDGGPTQPASGGFR